MTDGADFITSVEAFPWDSDVQKEGFLAFVQYLRKFGKDVAGPFQLLELCFIIQKSHEAAEYWQDALGNQVAMLQQDIVELKKQNDVLAREVDVLRIAVKSQLAALQYFAKSTD